MIKLTLHPGSYDWQFVPEAGKTFSDSGTAACHGAPPAPAPEPGPITRVGSSSNSASPGTALTLARPVGTVAGQVMVASVVTSEDDPALAAPDGWTVVEDQSIPGTLRQVVSVKVAGPAEPASYTWTLSARRQVAGGITTYSGVDTVRPIDASAVAVSPAAGTAVAAPSITTTTAGTMLVHFAALNAEGTLMAPGGMTQRWLAAAPTGAVTDALAASSDTIEPLAGATGICTATATEPGAHIAAVLALRPAP